MRALALTLIGATFLTRVIAGDDWMRSWQGSEPGEVGSCIEGSGWKARSSQERGRDEGCDKRPFRGGFSF